MCIIIVKPAEAHVTKARLKEAWNSNKDGGGFTYIDQVTGEIVIKKGFFEFKDFYRTFRAAEREHSSNFIIHMRIATHGYVNEENTHPHLVNDNLVMAHNGVLRMMTVPKDSPFSDTIIFIDQILKKLPEGWEKSSVICTLLESYIDKNKIALMNGDGDVIILNKDLGHEDQGCWYSNYSYRPVSKSFCGYSNNTWVTASSTKTNILPFSTNPKCAKCHTPIKPDLFDEGSGLCITCLVSTQHILNRIDVGCVMN